MYVGLSRFEGVCLVVFGFGGGWGRQEEEGRPSRTYDTAEDFKIVSSGQKKKH